MSGCSFQSRGRQHGFSMVELMVAVTIGLFLLIGLTQVFVGSRQTYRMQEGIGRIQENGRFAVEMIGRQLRMAGYRSQPLVQTPVNAITGQDNIAGTAERLAGTDVITLRYFGAAVGQTTDCLGSAITPNTQVVMTLFINPDRSLRCTSSVGPLVNQPLLDGIADMQVVYGERVVNNPVNPAANTFRYVTANNVSNWNNVISVRIDVTADSVESVDPGLEDSGGRLERIYSTTVTLRNRL